MINSFHCKKSKSRKFNVKVYKNLRLLKTKDSLIFQRQHPLEDDCNIFRISWGFKRFCFLYSLGSYFNRNHQITIGFIFFYIVITLPFKFKNEGCDPGEYGFNIHSNMLWLLLGPRIKGTSDAGSRTKSFRVPFFYVNFDKRLVLTNLENDLWKNENSLDYSKIDCWQTTVPYTFVYRNKDGRVTEIQEVKCTLTISEYYWSRYGLKWFKPLRTSKRYLNISLNSGIGSNRNSYKGGVMGWSEVLLCSDNDPIAKLREIERTKIFR